MLKIKNIHKMAGKACMGNLIESAYENEQLNHPRYSFKMKNGFDYGDYKNIDINHQYRQ